MVIFWDMLVFMYLICECFMYIVFLGKLVFGSCLKVFSDYFYGVVDEVYCMFGVFIELCWLLVLCYLWDVGFCLVIEVVDVIGQIYLVVSQFMDKLVCVGMVCCECDLVDGCCSVFLFIDQVYVLFGGLGLIWCVVCCGVSVVLEEQVMYLFEVIVVCECVLVECLVMVVIFVEYVMIVVMLVEIVLFVLVLCEYFYCLNV